MDQIAISVYHVTATSSRVVAYSQTKRATVPFQVTGTYGNGAKTFGNIGDKARERGEEVGSFTLSDTLCVDSYLCHRGTVLMEWCVGVRLL